MFTRQDYLDNKCTHREYYAQFVTLYIKAMVSNFIGINHIKASMDEHFNDIPLGLWDTLRCGGKTLSDNVCIAKEAAKQLKEEN